MLTERITVIRLMLRNAKKYMSMLQLQFQNEVEIQRKVAFIQTRVYHTQNNALHKNNSQS